MIVAERKPFDEIKEMVKNFKKWRVYVHLSFWRPKGGGYSK
jgi:hypothetical protein